MILDKRFARIGGELIEIQWPDSVVKEYQDYWRRKTIRDMIEVPVFLGFVPGRRP